MWGVWNVYIYCSPVPCYMTGWLPDIWCSNSVFNSPDTDMLITWRWYVYTWHLIPDTWHLTLVLDMLSLNTWYLTIGMLSFDVWHMLLFDTNTLNLMLWHLTGYYYTWHLYCVAYSWLSLYGDLTWLLYCYQTSGTPELLYLWTHVPLNFWTPVPLNSCIPYTHISCIVTLVNSTVILASGRGVGLTRMYPTIMLASDRS